MKFKKINGHPGVDFPPRSPGDKSARLLAAPAKDGLFKPA